MAHKPHKPRKLGRGLSSLLQPTAPVSVAVPAPEPNQAATNDLQTPQSGGVDSTHNKEKPSKSDKPNTPEKSEQPNENRRVDANRHDLAAALAAGRKSQSSTNVAEGVVAEVPVDQMMPNTYQPRREFDPAAISTLADSILRSGLMQPIIVRPLPSAALYATSPTPCADESHPTEPVAQHIVFYEIVAGERRWRAARQAGLATIPAVVRGLSDAQAAEWALVENMQREDLNPIERGYGLRALTEQFSLSPKQVGQRVGLERSTVANLIRLTELEKNIQQLVARGSLSMGHARALLGVPAGDQRLQLATTAATEGWTVRTTEQACRERTHNKNRTTNTEVTQNPNTTQSQRESILADLEKRISTALGTKATITMRRKGNQGRIILDFYDLEHFEDLMERMGVAEETL